MEYIKLFARFMVRAINCLSAAALGAIFGAIAMYLFALGEYEKLDNKTQEQIRELEQERDHAKRWECFELKFDVSKIKDELQDCRQKLDACDYGFKQCKFLYKKGNEVCLPEERNE